MSFARAARMIQPAASIGLWRAAAMGLSLAAVTLTFYALGPQHFTLFNLVMFYIAVGSAVAAPVNRAFWAGESAQRFAPATLSSAAIVALVMTVGLAFSAPLDPVWLGAAFVIAAAVYSMARVVERYGYGQLLASGQGSRAIFPIVLFAACDVAVAAALWLTSADSLLVRLAVPPLLFVLFLFWGGGKTLLNELKASKDRLWQSAAFARTHLLSGTGLSVIGLGIIATAAAAGDRFLAVHLPLEPAGFGAAYLLAVSYAIALQTLTAFLFDLARVHVFHDGSWKAEARQFSLLSAGAVAGLAVVAAIAHPLLVGLGLLPEVIGPILWAGVLARSASTALAYSLNVDHFQTGRFGPIVAAHFLIFLGGTTGYLLLHSGASQATAAAVMIVTSCGISAAMAWLLSRRIGR